MNRNNKLKKALSILTYFLYLIVITFIGLEIVLRFYSPLPTRIKANKIVLPKNQKYSLPNSNFTKLAHNSVHFKNNIGFRGENWETNSKRLKILFIGGSTTECFYVDEKKNWPLVIAQKLGTEFLVNNAGLNGHSTVGHIALLKDYANDIKPNVAFFLIGINDLALTENGSNQFDEKMINNSIEKKILKLEEYSRVLNLIHSFYRSYQAYKLGISDNVEWKLKETKNPSFLSDEEWKSIKLNHENSQINYKKRILEIIDICKSNNIKPVFITQPLLFGEGKDPSTSLDLQNYFVYKMKGYQYFEKLQLYNKTLIGTCISENISFIDLAMKLPKDSKYFIDDMHFSDEGCEKVSEIVYNEIGKQKILN